MNDLALLVVDVQQAALDHGPWRGDEVLASIARLIAACRDADVPVIHVQHDGAPGEDNAPGTPGWEIHPAVRPAPGEKVVRKTANSAFRGTDLREHLEDAGLRTLILVGIQTEYCVDTTCRVAFEHGFEVIVPEGTNTTYDNGEIGAEQIHRLWNERIFADRFARVVPMAETLERIAAAAPARSGP